MSKTSIEWTEETWNPVVGCSIVSPGCTNCYAMKMAARIEKMREAVRPDGTWHGPMTHYAGTTKKVNGNAVWTGKLAQASDSVLLAPLHRKKPTTYFVNSMGDLFHEDCPDAWIDRVFAVMALSRQHTFQVLTKRAARMRDYFSKQVERVGMIDCSRADRIGDVMMIHHKIDSGFKCVSWPLPNVWLGVSCERQQEADERIPLLLQTPAAIRFISAEPLLGPIDAHLWMLTCPAIDWVIAGGESGQGARPMHPDWARSLRRQCAAAGVKFFFKQWGAFKDGSDFAADAIAVLNDGRQCDGTKEALEKLDRDSPVMRFNPTMMRRVGKKAAGRLLDNAQYNGMPEVRK